MRNRWPPPAAAVARVMRAAQTGAAALVPPLRAGVPLKISAHGESFSRKQCSPGRVGVNADRTTPLTSKSPEAATRQSKTAAKPVSFGSTIPLPVGLLNTLNTPCLPPGRPLRRHPRCSRRRLPPKLSAMRSTPLGIHGMSNLGIRVITQVAAIFLDSEKIAWRSHGDRVETVWRPLARLRRCPAMPSGSSRAQGTGSPAAMRAGPSR